ncbi:hypothetical protein D9M68_483530 [compost metagenome]
METITSAIASATPIGPPAKPGVSARAAVASTQPVVVMTSTRFLAARRSAQAPMAGIVSITMAYEVLRAAVHAKVAQGAPLATPPTK